MEINVTKLVERADEMYLYSASRMELGDDAGQVTWENAIDCIAEEPLLTESDVPYARDYLGCLGAWTREELEAMSSDEINALTLQFIAGDVRKRFETGDEEETAQLYQLDDGTWWYCLTH